MNNIQTDGCPAGSHPGVDMDPEEKSIERVGPGEGAPSILVVEDEEGIRDLLQELLEMDGYKILTARNGVQAVALAESHPDPIDLLLTDVEMPGMSGLELAERLISKRAGMKVLYMSGYSQDVVVRPGCSSAAPVFLQKPFTPEDLLHKVKEMLGRE